MMDAQEDLETALFKAVVNGNVEDVRKGLTLKDNVNGYGRYHVSLLHIAANYGQVNMMELLLIRNGEINKVSKARSISRNVSHSAGAPLHLAASKGHLDCVQLLIEKGADLNIKDNSGCTPVEEAYKAEQFSCLKLLTENGAKVPENMDIHITSAIGDERKLASLLVKCDDIDYQDRYGNTALHLAVSNGQSKCGMLLIKAGIGINLQNRDQNTPLHKAVQKKQTNCVMLLQKMERILMHGMVIETLPYMKQY